MATHPLQLQMAELVLALVPDLTRNLQESIQQAIKHKNMGLQEAWARRRQRFQMEFETSLRPALAQVRQGLDPLAPRRQVAMDQLALVDEHQALRDVGIAHVVELATEANRSELFRLQNFFAGLNQNSQRPSREPNPLRPALFARALSDALSGSDLRAEGHYSLMQAAAPALAAALAPIYTALGEVLARERLTAMVSSVDLGNSPRRPLSSVPGGLDNLRQRVEAMESQRLSLGSGQGPNLLQRLYDQMLADPHLLPPVKAQLARLQIAVSRLAHHDPQLLRQQDHPTWRLINAVAAYGAAFQDAQDSRLRDFLQFLEDQTELLINSPAPNRQQFENLQRLIDGFIARQARERSGSSTAALAALERERQRGPWAALLREQLDAQLHSARISPSVREFLLGIWVDVIVQAMVLEGHEARSVQELVAVVDELVESLVPKRDPAAQEKQRHALPALVARIEHGLHSIALSDSKRSAILKGLAQQHARALRGLGESTAPEPAWIKETEVKRLLDERDSEFGSVWAHAEVNRAELPTEPLPLADARLRDEAVGQWLRHLQIGGWFHLFVNSHWLTAQLVWVSEGSQFYLFVGQDATDRHSMTQGALAQLYANGLVTYLEQEGLLERAVSTLMQDLDP
ncbi:hypothetical protein HNQ51_000552 [Inhella inkyongensis]|uniref:DUF1631 family protein n=1 Tax=Inhella inkyongensis TaxID=392593 RepID=A0A840S415_9BURK|nr:DUF1631 family protein [Inhella inkyongensis]MBB5203259.1 hypothetical protein [Inhella inkyongensis]